MIYAARLKRENGLIRQIFSPLTNKKKSTRACAIFHTKLKRRSILWVLAFSEKLLATLFATRVIEFTSRSCAKLLSLRLVALAANVHTSNEVKRLLVIDSAFSKSNKVVLEARASLSKRSEEKRRSFLFALITEKKECS
jgi:hypothetical protein